jgi:hypothetical protein
MTPPNSLPIPPKPEDKNSKPADTGEEKKN